MPILNKLNIAIEEPRNQNNPFAKAKSNLLANLTSQLKAAKAMVAGETYLVTKMQTVEENGVNVRKPVQRPIRHWYWRDSTGAVRFAVRVSNKRIELSKGKTDIVVGNDKELPSIIQQLIEAVKAGELDKTIEEVSALRRKRKTAK
mgnify:CR=1 FL=1